MRRPLLQGVVMLLGAAGFLAGLLALHRLARDRLEQGDHYAVDFAAITCPAPPGVDRGDFLAEVQYLGGMPSQLSVLDDNLASRLADAFARHPSVEKVEEVVVLPKREVRVRLRFRAA